MSIVPASCLEAADFAVLGNNVIAAVRQERLETLQAVNRSLAAHGEQVDRLYGTTGRFFPHGSATAAAPATEVASTRRRRAAC